MELSRADQLRSANAAPACLVAFLALAAIPGAQAALTEYNVGWNQQYLQSGASVTLNGEFFVARAYMQASTDYDTGTLNGVYPLSLTFDTGGPSLAYRTAVLAPAVVEATFGAGPYTFDVLNTSTSAAESHFLYGAGSFFTGDVPALTVGSEAALQGMQPGQDLPVVFNSFTPQSGVPVANTYFEIFDGAQNLVFGGNALPTTQTQVTIPGGVLVPGQSYTYVLIFDSQSPNCEVNNGFFCGGLPIDNLSDVTTQGSFTTASAVPEPQSWACLLTGMAMTLAVIRRRFHLTLTGCGPSGRDRRRAASI